MSIHKKIIAVLVIIVLALAVSVLVRKGIVTNTTPEDSFMPQKTDGTAIRRVTLQEKYIDGSYTVFGVVQTPTPCHRVEVTSAKTGDNTYIISLMTQSTQGRGEVCAQVITDQVFEYTFDAPEDAIFVGAIDGEIVEFNRVRLPEDAEFVNPIEYTKG